MDRNASLIFVIGLVIIAVALIAAAAGMFG